MRQCCLGCGREASGASQLCANCSPGAHPKIKGTKVPPWVTHTEANGFYRWRYPKSNQDPATERKVEWNNWRYLRQVASRSAKQQEPTEPPKKPTPSCLWIIGWSPEIEERFLPTLSPLGKALANVKRKSKEFLFSAYLAKQKSYDDAEKRRRAEKRRFMREVQRVVEGH